MFDQHTLLTVGPVNMSKRVRNALSRVDFCHREKEFADLTLSILSKLEQVYESATGRYSAVMITGSGSAAIESMITTCIPKEEALLVVSNGVYGERAFEMANRHQKNVQRLNFEWEEAICLETVEQYLQDHPDIQYLSSVHHETTTGRLNDIQSLMSLCRKYGVKLLLDTVSSFGAEQIDFDPDVLLAVCASSNKCLHGPPGLSFILIEKSFLEKNKSYASSLYLDLVSTYNAQKSGFSPFTQATHVATGFYEALLEFEEQGGQKARLNNYLDKAEFLRNGLKDMSLETILADDAYCSMFTSYFVPANWTYEALHDELKKHGYIIYAGSGRQKQNMFRVGHMGDISKDELQDFLKVFGKLLKSNTQDQGEVA